MRREREKSVHVSPVSLPRLLGFVLGVAVWFVAAQGSARDLVQLVNRQSSHPVVDEIVLRARAELMATGFQVLRCSHANSGDDCSVPNAVARLEILEEGGVLSLRAEARGGWAPLTQELDLRASGISAEVAAIRAVELLRATMLVAVREGNIELEEGGSLENFTSLDGEEPESEVEPLPESRPPPERTPSQRPSPLSWSLGLGPSIAFPHGDLAPGLGGDLFLDVIYRAIYFGVAGDFALVPTNIETIEGSTDITSQTGVARFGWAAHCGPVWDCRLGAAVGAHRYEFQTSPAAGFVGTDATHVGLYAGGDVTFARYFGDLIGVFLRVRMGGVSKAPRLQLEPPLRLAAPAWGTSVGVAFH